MIGAGKGDVFSEPGRRGKGKCFFFGGEFHFRKGQGSQVSFKKIQLCRQAAGKRDHIPLLADQPSVDLGQEMLVSLSGERKIVFFPRHQAAGFISEFIAVIVPPDADDGRNIQIPLLDDPAGILFQMIRKMRDQVFAFNLHGRYLLNSGNIIIYFTFRVNGDNMEKTRRNDGMKKVSVILADGFEEIEALTVVDLLRRAQIFVDTVSATEEYTVHGAHGINVQTEDLFDEVNFVESDMIVLPGGMPGTTHLNEHAGVRRVVKDFYEEGKYVAAICAAPTVLGNLGILKGKRITCYPTVENQIQGAVITRLPAQVDGNIITGRGAGTAIDFALKLIEVLAGPEKAKEIRDGILYE